VGHNKQISAELPLSFRKKVIKFIKQFFLLSKGMQFLCTTTLIISYKNQPLLLSQVAALKKKFGK